MNSNPLDNVDAQDNVILLNLAAEVKNGARYTTLLENIQGHILRDNGRDHSLHILLRFKPAESNKLRNLIEQLAQATFSVGGEAFHYLGSAKEQALIGEMVRGTPLNDHKRKTYTVNFYLSKSGYEALQFKSAQLPSDPSFKAGLVAFMQALKQKGKLHDPTKDWDKTFDDIHAMIAIAHDEEMQIKGKAIVLSDPALQQLINAFEPYVITIEKGKVLYTSNDRKTNEVIEHFGFRDGISNPVFFTEEFEKRRAEDIDQKADQFSNAAPLRLVLADDPNYQNNEQAYGSYLVFGKLEQNVRAFEEDVQQLANRLTADPQSTDPDERVKRAKALVIGRFQDGTPLTLQNVEGGVPNKNGGIATSPNNFDYDGDPWSHTGAGRCPIHSHIRRANPRGEAVRARGEDAKHRIVRRGIPYGTRMIEPKDKPTVNDLPSSGVGLLFMCFQRDIGFQFEHIIDDWCLYPDHPDAVMRDTTGAATHRSNFWPAQWYQYPQQSAILSVESPFPKHVYLKGGEYFFAPSVKFLRELTIK